MASALLNLSSRPPRGRKGKEEEREGEKEKEKKKKEKGKTKWKGKFSVRAEGFGSPDAPWIFKNNRTAVFKGNKSDHLSRCDL